MIELYSFGNIVIDGKSFDSDCIISQDHVNGNWWRVTGHELAVADIKDTIVREKPEAVVIGKGKYCLMKILKETEEFLKDLRIELHSGSTDEAVKIYNKLFLNKKVVGFFHLTC